MKIVQWLFLLLIAAALAACGSSVPDAEQASEDRGSGDESATETRASEDESHNETQQGDHDDAHKGDEHHASEGHDHEGHDHEGHHSHHDPTGMTFEDAERFAKHFDDPGRDEWQKPAEVVTLLEISGGEVVADIGAGTGYFLPHLASAVGADGKVLGLDVSEPMVEYMSQRIEEEKIPNTEAMVVPATEPGLEEGSVDRVITVNTWHHIPSRVEYGKALLASLRDGGMLMVVDYTLESERGPNKKHKLEPETVIEELESAGFKAALADETLPEQYIVIGRKP